MAQQARSRPNIYPRQLTEQARYLGDAASRIDPASDAYLTITLANEGSSEESATVTAASLVIDANGTFTSALAGRALKTLTIVADSIALQTTITFPGTELSIYARDLIIGEDCWISTEPSGYPAPAAPKSDGADGRKGGDITLYLGQLRTTSQKPILITRGAAGQAPGPGTPGTAGAIADGWTESTVGFVSGAFNQNYNDTLGQCTEASLARRLWQHSGNAGHDIIDIDYQVSVASPTSIWERIPESHSWQAPIEPGDGQPPTELAGKPGSGGDAGSIRSTVKVDPSWAIMTGGASAAPVPTKGGAAGYVRGKGGTHGPGSKAVTTCDASFWGSTYAIQSVTSYAAKRAGADHPGFQPQRPKGADGSIDAGLKPPEGWLHPLHITVFRHVIDDARLNGDLEWAEYFLTRILAALDAWEAASSTVGSAPTASDLAFCAAHRAFAATRLQMARKLDFFGNPAGWTPTLSLAANLTAYHDEIDRALPIVYLAEWFEANAKAVADKTRNYGQAIKALEDKRAADGRRFAALTQQVGPMTAQISALENSVQSFQNDLKAEEARLRKQATLEVWSAHLLKIASALCSLIPVGQPELGMAGGALNSVSDYMVGKDPTIKNAGTDLLSGLSNLTKYGLDRKANAIDSALSAKPSGGVKPAAAKKALADDLHKAAGNLGALTGAVTDQFKELCAAKDDIEVQLSKLENDDKLFQSLAERLRALGAEKEALFQRLNSCLALMAELSGQIGESYVHEIHLHDEMANSATEISQTTRAILRDMRRRAMANLQLFQYYLVKSYEYQMLESPSSVDLRMDMVLDNIRKTAEQSSAVQPQAATGATFDPMKTYLQSVYDRILTDLIKKIQAPKAGEIGFQQITNSRTYQLTTDELARLNDPAIGQVCVNTFEKGLVKIEEENARIVGLTVQNIAGTAKAAGQNRTCRVSVQFDGEGLLRNATQLLAIRAYDAGQIDNATRDFVREWSATFDERTGKSRPDQPSARSAELVSALLDRQKAQLDQGRPGKPKPLASRLYDPPAWCELIVRCDDAWLDLSDVTITLDVSFQSQPNGNVPLRIQEEYGRCGPIWLTDADGARRTMTSSFDVLAPNDVVGLAAGYFGDKMPGGLVDLDNPAAKDVSGPGPWKLQMPVSRGRRLQIVLRTPVFQAPLQAPRVWGWSAKRSVLDRKKPAQPQNWQLHGGVQYALSFVDGKGQETALGPWSKEATSLYYVFPILCDIWRDPSGTSQGRRLYRRFIDAHGNVHSVERVHIRDDQGKDALANNDELRKVIDANP